MDIRIKGSLDGIGTAVLLKERFDVPIVYLTAHADEATLDRAKKTEPFGYLMKPIKPDALRSAIEVARYKFLMERHLRGARSLVFVDRAVRSPTPSSWLTSPVRITFMNPAAELMNGQDPRSGQATSSARECSVCSTPMRFLARTRPLDRALREKKAIQIPETVLQSSGGSRRLISDSAAPVMDGSAMLGAVMVFRDVTEHRQSQRQLEIADRLASLGTMAAGVAHEINNPLAVVVANAEFVLEHLERARVPSVPAATAAEPARARPQGSH